MNATKLGLKKTMLQWTAAIIATIIGSVIFTVAMTKKAMEMQPTTIEMPSVDMTPTE
jgi:nicotinamide riboside transporter PnuC